MRKASEPEVLAQYRVEVAGVTVNQTWQQSTHLRGQPTARLP